MVHVLLRAAWTGYYSIYILVMASQMLGEVSFPGIATVILLTCSVQAEKKTNHDWGVSLSIASPYNWSASYEDTHVTHTHTEVYSQLPTSNRGGKLANTAQKMEKPSYKRKASLLETRMTNFASWGEDNSTCNCNFYPMGSIWSQTGEKNFQHSLL